MADGVAVIGGGPAGLAAAIELRRRGVESVTVIEREAEPGGIPRHANHTGFGMLDLRRVLSGPRYARRYRELAERAGVELMAETMVTECDPGGRLRLTSPDGPRELEPAAMVLATGCRERPRSARLVPGSRPAGVMTTSTLQQLVYLHDASVGRRAVVVGAEHVSFSAVVTLAHGGASVAGLVTELARHQSLAAFRIGAAIRYRAPVWARTGLTAIHGDRQVEAVELTDLDSGRTRRVECDLVVFTADWIPDHELAVMAGLAMDAGTRGPAVDPALRTSRPGVFAAGNLLHGAETADVAALGGRHAGAAAAAFLANGGYWPDQRVPIECEPPLRWIAPNVVVAGAGEPPRGRFALRSASFVQRPTVDIAQAGRTLWSGRLRRLVPGRSAALRHAWTAAVDARGGPVSVRVTAGG
jgi:thioredoxin reductase